jgi:DNA-binding transcriptional MerR regulator
MALAQTSLFRDDRAGYRAPVAARLAGISYRQLDHWTTKQIVTPSVQDADGSGSQRLYGFDDIVRLRMVKRLRDAGVSLQKITKVLDALADRGQTLDDVTLLNDGTDLYVCTDQQDVFDVLMSGQGVFAIALAPLRESVSADVVGIPTERATRVLPGRDQHAI